MKGNILGFVLLYFLIISGFVIAQPVITSFTPSSGPVGTPVVITGANFNTTASNNVVYFGATKASVSAATASSLTVTVPLGNSHRYITVTDLITGLSCYSGLQFHSTFSCYGAIDVNSFGDQKYFPTALQPRGIAAGDIDGDGLADIIAACQNSDSVSILRNISSSGNINFASKTDFPAGPDAYGVALGDIDGDGKLDVAVANFNWNSEIRVSRNVSTPGNISLAAPLSLTFTTSYDPYSIDIADLDGDGKADIVVANSASSSCMVFRNTSTVGSISFAPVIAVPSGNSSTCVRTGDIDGDGKVEIVLAKNSNNYITVLKNNSTVGAISFAAGVNFTVGGNPYSLSLGDLDGNGKKEVVTVNDNNNNVSVLRNTSVIGTITFAAKVDYNLAFNSPKGVDISDLDGDGKPDIVCSLTSNQKVSVLRNNCSVGSISFAVDVSYGSGKNSYLIVASDFDNDEKTDLAATCNNNADSISVLRNMVQGPVITNTNTLSICSGSSVNLSLTSTYGTSYTWTAASNANINGESTLTQTTGTIGDILVNTTTTNQIVTYSATATNSSLGCVGSVFTLSVTVKPAPTLTTSTTVSKCSGIPLSISLGSNPASTRNWIAGNNPNVTGESITTQTTTPIRDTLINVSGSPQVVLYTVNMISNSGGCANIQTITVTVNPLPIVSFSGLNSNCCTCWPSQTLSGSPSGGTFTGPGMTGNSFSPSTAGVGTHTITYSYTDGNGCTNSTSQATTVSMNPPAPDICMVTTDSIGTYNVIYWDKTIYPNVDTFFIYRDTANNNFALIGKVSVDSLSLFIDTSRSIGAVNGDPNIGTYRYKLAYKDIFGIMSLISPYHNTVYTIDLGTGVFTYNQYEIEFQPIPVPGLSQYILRRDNANTGNYITAATIGASSTSINDPQYATYQTIANWRVETNWSTVCTPTMRQGNSTIETALVKSRSNVRNNRTASLSPANFANTVKIFPNPATDMLSIVLPQKCNNCQLLITNVLGDLVKSVSLSGKEGSISVADLSSGVYLIRVFNSGKSVYIEKLIKQ